MYKIKIKINETKPIESYNGINIYNFESFIYYAKVDINQIKSHLKPDVRLQMLGENETLDVSKLNTTNLTNTRKLPTPTNARKLYCPDLRLTSNDLPNLLTYIDSLAQLHFNNLDYQKIKFAMVKQFLTKNN